MRDRKHWNRHANCKIFENNFALQNVMRAHMTFGLSAFETDASFGLCDPSPTNRFQTNIIIQTI